MKICHVHVRFLLVHMFENIYLSFPLQNHLPVAEEYQLLSTEHGQGIALHH